MSKSTNVSHWIDLVKAGDSAAANRIWQRYFDRLVRAVRARLYGQNRAVSDEEDIVLSVFDSFYNAAENGRFCPYMLAVTRAVAAIRLDCAGLLLLC